MGLPKLCTLPIARVKYERTQFVFWVFLVSSESNDFVALYRHATLWSKPFVHAEILRVEVSTALSLLLRVSEKILEETKM